jgi:hypothetical protein
VIQVITYELVGPKRIGNLRILALREALKDTRVFALVNTGESRW